MAVEHERHEGAFESEGERRHGRDQLLDGAGRATSWDAEPRARGSTSPVRAGIPWPVRELRWPPGHAAMPRPSGAPILGSGRPERVTEVGCLSTGRRPPRGI